MAHNQDRSSGHLTSGIIHTTASFSCKRPAPLHVAIPLTLTNVHSCDALLATLCGCVAHVLHHSQCACALVYPKLIDTLLCKLLIITITITITKHNLQLQLLCTLHFTLHTQAHHTRTHAHTHTIPNHNTQTQEHTKHEVCTKFPSPKSQVASCQLPVRSSKCKSKSKFKFRHMQVHTPGFAMLALVRGWIWI